MNQERQGYEHSENILKTVKDDFKMKENALKVEKKN